MMQTRVAFKRYLVQLVKQRVPQLHNAFVCPRCGGIQSAVDFIRLGLGAGYEDVHWRVHTECIQRWQPDGQCSVLLSTLQHGSPILKQALLVQSPSTQFYSFPIATPNDAKQHMDDNITHGWRDVIVPRPAIMDMARAMEERLRISPDAGLQEQHLFIHLATRTIEDTAELARAAREDALARLDDNREARVTSLARIQTKASDIANLSMMIHHNALQALRILALANHPQPQSTEADMKLPGSQEGEG